MIGRARKHVPYNQCHPGSRGGTTGDVHLYVTEPLRSGRLQRDPSGDVALCGKKAWWDRDPEREEWDPARRCPRCVDIGDRHGVEWPTQPQPDPSGGKP